MASVDLGSWVERFLSSDSCWGKLFISSYSAGLSCEYRLLSKSWVFKSKVTREGQTERSRTDWRRYLHIPSQIFIFILLIHYFISLVLSPYLHVITALYLIFYLHLLSITSFNCISLQLHINFKSHYSTYISMLCLPYHLCVLPFALYIGTKQSIPHCHECIEAILWHKTQQLISNAGCNSWLILSSVPSVSQHLVLILSGFLMEMLHYMR